MRLHLGEPEAAGWRVVSVEDAVRQLHDASPGVTGRPRVVAIDGRGGAGKTTLAERLRAVVPNSAVVHTDDIAWNQAYFDWGAVAVRPWTSDPRPGSLTTARAESRFPPAWE